MSLPAETPSTFLQRLKQDLKNDLIAGLLVIIPLATTIWLTITVARWVIDFLTSVPKQVNPFNDLNPLLGDLLNLGIGFSVPLLSLLVIGLMARNIAGQWLLALSERILKGIPLAGAVYTTLKQLLGTLLDSSNKFRRVVLLEYPRRGIWAIGFVTGSVAPDLSQSLTVKRLDGAVLSGPVVSVFIPTTPNPTTGWYAIVPESEVINTEMTVEDAFKVLVSGGIVSPGTMPKPPVMPLAADPTVPLEIPLEIPLDLPRDPYLDPR
jgi:uncharacterized membrane protein